MYRISFILFVCLICIVGAAHSQANSPQEITPLAEGVIAPDISVTSLSGEPKRLAMLRGGKPTLVIFFRGGWCPYCSLHLGELQKIEKELLAMGVQILAISPSSQKRLQESAKKLDLTYQLFSDRGLKAATEFGVSYKVDDKYFKELLASGVDINEESGDTHRLLPVPAAFLLDSEGKIRFRYANPDYRIRISSERLLAEAKSLK